MIKINICGTKHEYDDFLESWINERYHNIKRIGDKFWFIVDIDTSDIHLSLPSANAPHGGGKSYCHFNRNERRIIDIWKELDTRRLT